MYRSVLWPLVALTASTVLGEDCEFTPEEDLEQCCHLSEEYPLNMYNTQECLQKFPPPPTASDGSPTITDAELDAYSECLHQCEYSNSGLLTADKKLNKTAISKAFSSDDKELNIIGTAAVDKCITLYLKDVDPSQKCKSGAVEFQMCMFQEVFLNCPRSLWNSSKECAGIRAKVTKCSL